MAHDGSKTIREQKEELYEKIKHAKDQIYSWNHEISECTKALRRLDHQDRKRSRTSTDDDGARPKKKAKAKVQTPRKAPRFPVPLFTVAQLDAMAEESANLEQLAKQWKIPIKKLTEVKNKMKLAAEVEDEEEIKSGSEEAESGEAESGEAESGEAESGEAESGEAESGEAESGEAESGEADSGGVESGVEASEAEEAEESEEEEVEEEVEEMDEEEEEESSD